VAHDHDHGARGEDGKGPAIVASVRLRKSPVAARPLIERDRTGGRGRETSARTGEPARDGVDALLVDFLASFADARAR